MIPTSWCFRRTGTQDHAWHPVIWLKMLTKSLQSLREEAFNLVKWSLAWFTVTSIITASFWQHGCQAAYCLLYNTRSPKVHLQLHLYEKFVNHFISFAL
jgi:hypothetical protein